MTRDRSRCSFGVPLLWLAYTSVAIIVLFLQGEIKGRFSPDTVTCEVCESDCPCPDAACNCDDDCDCPACI